VFDEEVVKEVFGEDGILVGLLVSGTAQSAKRISKSN